jgi:2-phospho-L-lactate guanylyltransferase
MRTVAILPVKRFERAKQRLGDAVAPEQRQTLASAMLADVLSALARVEGIDGLVVVTAEPAAAQVARAAGARVVDDPEETGQSPAARRGIDAALETGAERALLVPGDCPALDAAELSELLARYTDAGVVIVPDRHGSGTNALLLTPPEVLAPSFGPGSLARHAARGRAAGATVRIAQAPSLELDVDTPGDLAALRAALAERPGAAPCTRALFDELAAQPEPAAR